MGSVMIEDCDKQFYGFWNPGFAIIKVCDGSFCTSSSSSAFSNRF